MRFLLLLVLLGVLAWPAAATLVPPSVTALPAAAAVWLQQPGAGNSILPGGGGSPPTRNHLPFSIRPHTENACSVDGRDPGQPNCSALTNDGQCSSHVDSAQTCSAFALPGQATEASCSTLGTLTRTGCSVLQPQSRVRNEGSTCSAFSLSSPSSVVCSVLGPGDGAACSAENPTEKAGNACSAFSFEPDALVLCSVINPGLAGNFGTCTTGVRGRNAKCSSIGKSGSTGAACSVGQLSFGQCTAFTGAPPDSCSVIRGQGACSVIGQPPQQGRCRQP